MKAFRDKGDCGAKKGRLTVAALFSPASLLATAAAISLHAAMSLLGGRELSRVKQVPDALRERCKAKGVNSVAVS